MAKIVKKSPIPLYGAAAVWLLWAVFLPMYALWHFALVPVSCLALVVMTKEIVSLLFRRRPDLVASH